MEEFPTRRGKSLFEMDENVLLSIFPAEVWKAILTGIKSPEDKKNVADSSPYFRELLKDQRVVYLFPEVVDILAVRNEQRRYEVVEESVYDCIDLNYDEDSDDDSFDFNYKTKKNEWRDTMLNCRLVCVSWNKSVEKCYQQRKMNGIYELGETDDPMSPLAWMDVIEWPKTEINVSSAAQILKNFEQTHYIGSVDARSKNPFLGRSLFIRSWNTELNQDRLTFLENVRKILEYFGKEIWYLNFELFEETGLRVTEWLELMPNLISIGISGTSVSWSNRNPLPKFEKLEVIRSYSGSERQGLVNQLIRSNQHISGLFFRQNPILKYFDRNIGKGLANLKNVSVNMDGRWIQTFGAHWKQLSTLELRASNSAMKASKLFKLLENNWADTLTALHLDFVLSKNQDDFVKQSKDLRLNLPRVRKLHVRLSTVEFCFLDFALPLEKSLEHFRIERYTQREDNRPSSVVMATMARLKSEQIVEFIGFEERMEESNIWKIFDKLSTFELRGYDSKSTNAHVVYRRGRKRIFYEDFEF